MLDIELEGFREALPDSIVIPAERVVPDRFEFGEHNSAPFPVQPAILQQKYKCTRFEISQISFFWYDITLED